MALMDLLPGRNRTEPTPEPDPTPEETPAPPPVAHRGRLEIGGMFPIDWITTDPASVERARMNFDAAIRSGYMAQSYSSRPSVASWGSSRMDGEVTRTFDPEADEVRMSLPYAGG